MTVSLTETIQAPAADTASRTRGPTPLAEGVESALASVGTAASEAASATVSFSSQALHALEHAGEMAVDGAESLAVGAWHAVEHAATEVADVAEAGWDGLKAGLSGLESAGEAVADGASALYSGSKTVAKQIGHYAEVGLEATGAAVSDVASGAVMAASAGGKALMSII